MLKRRICSSLDTAGNDFESEIQLRDTHT